MRAGVEILIATEMWGRSASGPACLQNLTSRRASTSDRGNVGDKRRGLRHWEGKSDGPGKGENNVQREMSHPFSSKAAESCFGGIG